METTESSAPTRQRRDGHKPDAEYLEEFTDWLRTDPSHVDSDAAREFIAAIRRSGYENERFWLELASDLVEHPYRLRYHGWKFWASLLFDYHGVVYLFREPWSRGDKTLAIALFLVVTAFIACLLGPDSTHSDYQPLFIGLS